MAVQARVRGRTAALTIGTVAISALLPIVGAHAVDPGKDGAIVYVMVDEATGAAGLYTEAQDRTGVKRIVNDDAASSPAWSPNGKQIAYSGTGGIRIVNSDGSFVRTVTPQGDEPTW